MVRARVATPIDICQCAIRESAAYFAHAKGFDRYASPDDNAHFAPVAYCVTARASWDVGQLKYSGPIQEESHERL
jgi:hypothetical protein